MNLTGINVLVTGGMGYIGSHTIVELIQYDCNITIVDMNQASARKDALNTLIGEEKCHLVNYEHIDITNGFEIQKLFKKQRFDVCIHFAAFKNVGESNENPLSYYYNNVGGLLTLLDACVYNGCHNFIFSSSCTVYGNDEQQAPFIEKSIDELDIRSVTNPYATSKYMCEKIIEDVCKRDQRMRCVNLRYFNPIGSHESGLLHDESIEGKTANLMPLLLDVLEGKKERIHIFGKDYDTVDGTCVRDFVHVVDVAKAHVKAVFKLFTLSPGKAHTYNIGTGQGCTVLEIIKTMSKMTNKVIPCKIDKRREGDLPVAYADTTKSKEELKFVAEKTIEDMCRDACKCKNIQI